MSSGRIEFGELPESVRDRIANPRSGFGLREFESRTLRAVVDSGGRAAVWPRAARSLPSGAGTTGGLPPAISGVHESNGAHAEQRLGLDQP